MFGHAQTRKYQLGCTEVVRGTSNAWAEVMLDPEQHVRPRFLILWKFKL